jgi:hypothetical protein
MSDQFDRVRKRQKYTDSTKIVRNNKEWGTGDGEGRTDEGRGWQEQRRMKSDKERLCPTG